MYNVLFYSLSIEFLQASGNSLAKDWDENSCPDIPMNPEKSISGVMSDALIASTPSKLSLTKFYSPKSHPPATRVVLKDISPIATINAKSGDSRRISPKGGSGHSPSHNGSFNKTSSKGVESPRKFEAVEIVKPEEKSLDLNWQERTEVITKFDHESYVQFAREFVEELVETAVKKSEKDCSLAIETETHSVTSLSISEGSFQSADHSNGNTSAYLPDLLQPEALYKRQTETDTDTNEYESATETEPPDVSEFQDLGSPSVGPLVNEVVGSLDETCLINGHSSLDTTLVQSSEASVLPITKDFPSISNSGIGDSFIDKFQRLKIDGSYIDAERSTDSSAEESEYLPCESSLIESESFSNNSQSESFPVDSNNIVSDIVVDTSVVKGYEDVNPVASLVNESEDTLPVTSIVNEPEDTLPVTSIVNEPEDNIPVTSVLEEPESNIPVISIVNDFDNIIPFTEVVDESEKSVSFIEKDLEICKTVTSPLKEFQNQVLISDVESEVLNTDSALLDSSKHIVVEPENRIPDISLVKEPELDTSILSSVKEPESNVILSNFVDHNILDSTFFVDSVLVDSSKSIDSNHNSPRERLVQETKEDASLFVSDPEVNQKVESIYLGAGDSNSFGIKETFAFSSFKDSLNESVVSDPKANEIIQDTFSLGKKETSFNSSGFEDSLNIGNETVILVPKESENEYKEGEEGSVNVITDVCKEIPVQETIFSKYLNESALLTELRDLCHSQEEKLKDTGASIDFTENRDECISAKPLLVPSHSSDYGDSIGKAVNNDTEVSVKESDSAEDKFSFLDEVDDFSNLALEAAKISQELLLVCKSVDCDTQSSSSYPLEDDYSYGSSSQDMTDNCNKVEGHSPVNRRSSPQISKSSNLSGLPQSEISDDDNKSNLEIDPFKRRSKLNSSPPLVNKSVSTGVDPFKRRSRIQNSPPPEANERDYPRSESDTKQSKQSSIVESSPKKIIEKVTIDQVASPSPVLNPEVNLSEAGPDIAQDEIFQSGDVFKDPSTFDFLSQAGSSNPTVNLRTESLYVKFDPLYSAVSTTNKNIPLPSSIMANSAGDASNAMASSKTKSKVHDNSELVSTMPKKEKAPEPDNKIMSELHSKSPAMNTSPNVKSSPDSKQQSPTAAAANGTIDQNSRPLSMVGGLLPGGLTMAEVSMARELLARKEAEMEERVAQERLRAEAAEKRAMEAEEREKEALKLVAEKTQVENQMSVIMQEYEKTISRVVAEKEQAKQKWEIEQENLKRERDEALTHLNNVEQAFSDVHRKYERSKTAIEGFKRNEDALTASVAECQANLRKQEQRYEVLKSHAEAQLEGANQELECVRRAQQLEITKLSAMLKKTELRLASLEETVDQKEKENQELVAICDELIGKLGAVGVDAGK